LTDNAHQFNKQLDQGSTTKSTNVHTEI
jgi:hypothetical protein